MRSAVGGPGPDQGTNPWSVSLGTGQRRMVLLAGLGCLLGGVGGLAAYLIVKLVALLSNLALLHRVGFTLPNLSHYHPGPGLLGVAVAGALVVVALAHWSPVIKGHGIPESLEAILFGESRIRPRAAFAKPVSAAVAMGTGGPFGAEGPIIVTGGSVGSLLGQVLSVSPDERRILLATGAAAGMAGVFNTPIAAVVLAVELLAFERSLRALVPLVL
ncbi:MAG TPA: chloride channel protein, partial [Acidimicrobiales bacterium]|nr:chloride channel protein [Acidimicrobiales bacterium]